MKLTQTQLKIILFFVTFFFWLKNGNFEFKFSASLFAEILHFMNLFQRDLKTSNRDKMCVSKFNDDVALATTQKQIQKEIFPHLLRLKILLFSCLIWWWLTLTFYLFESSSNSKFNNTLFFIYSLYNIHAYAWNG